MARRERNIYKRKDGRYEARYVMSRDGNGKAKYGAVYARTYAEVKVKLGEARKKILENLPISTISQQTIVTAMEIYLRSIQTKVKVSTHGLYQRYCESYISPYFKNTRCSQLTLEISQDFVDSMLRNGLSVITARSVFSLFKNGIKQTLPLGIFAIKLPKNPPKKVEVLTVDEQKRLEATAKNSDIPNEIAITLCLYTGIRIGELCGLLWSDIDFERRLLKINRTMQRIKNGENDGDKTIVVCLTPKSDTSQRDIPLPVFLVEFLKACQSKSAASNVIAFNGNPVEPRTVQRRFKKLLDSANLRDVNFHVLRHSFATRALEKGFDIKTLSEILGHASPAITLSKYAHVL